MFPRMGIIRLGDDSDSAQAIPSDVLVVDDHEVNLLLARRLVQRFGYTAATASSGRAALDLTLHLRFRLVLMDCQMPDIDGIEATRRIRSRETGDATRLAIVGLSASPVDSVRRDCLAAGMDDYLEKPIDFAALKSVLRHWVGEPRIPP
jgi:two-component system, sensor histidine kinase and response regulator